MAEVELAPPACFVASRLVLKFALFCAGYVCIQQYVILLPWFGGFGLRWGCIRGAGACAVQVHTLLEVHPGTSGRGAWTQERECCLLVLNLVSSTPSCIRRPRPRFRVLDVCGFV